MGRVQWPSARERGRLLAVLDLAGVGGEGAGRGLAVGLWGLAGKS